MKKVIQARELLLISSGLVFLSILIVTYTFVSLLPSSSVFEFFNYPPPTKISPRTGEKDSLPCKELNCSADFFLNEQKILEQRLKSEIPTNIYKDVLIKYASSAPNNQHAIAHIFGEELYKTTGSSGITVCDNSFAFGCFHGFLVNALSQEGIGTVKDLDRMCIQKYGEYNLGCQHGLGHGIAEYYGSANLPQALDTCATLSWKHQLMGCSGGVFMEYIMPALGGEAPGSVKIKPLDISDPYSPCNKVQERYQAECFYNLGNYYYHAVQKNSKAGILLCDSISNLNHRKACLLGFGNSIYSNTQDAYKTITECQSTSDKESETTCRAGAAWLLYTNVMTRPQTKKMCEGLKQLYYKQCLTDSNLLEIALKT